MTASAAIERSRYGATSVWVARGAIGGGFARRLADRIDHHFRVEDSPLVVDLRCLDVLDSCGVAALERSRAGHRNLRLVGRPRGWRALPLRLRLGLEGLGADADLAGALRAAAPSAQPADADLRRHARIPVGLPVEVVRGGRATSATLADLSPGGLRLERLGASFHAALAGAVGAPIGVFGLAADPLARELLGTAAAGAVPAVPVHLLANGGVGARFAESRSPV